MTRGVAGTADRLLSDMFSSKGGSAGQQRVPTKERWRESSGSDQGVVERRWVSFLEERVGDGTK